MMNDQRAYYGGYFWLAAVSFVVPLFVGWSAFEQLQPSTKPVPDPDVSGVDHNLFDYLLRTYVENGLVDYQGISRDYLFPLYLQQLSSCDPDRLQTDAERLALHCNAYNAFVIHGVISHKIHQRERNVLKFTPSAAQERLDELRDQLEMLKRAPTPDAAQLQELEQRIAQMADANGFFNLKEHIFAGETMSLNHLEHNVIRPVFQDPRVHVALVCAARSCPAIRPEAYVGGQLDRQLDDQSTLFANSETYVRYNRRDDELLLSPILSWYGEDWQAQGGYLHWLSERVEADALRQQLQDAEAGNLKVRFLSYDWSLNAVSGGHSGGGGGASFGSGSVPNE